MRLFTGIDLPDDVRERLERLIEQLRPSAHLNWTPAYNLHITTKFIGQWPEPRLEELKAVLGTVCARGAIGISVDGLNWLPNPHNPRIFLISVKGGPALADLAHATEDALEPLGIARERRPYSPHLTLARIKAPAPLAALRQAIAGLESVDFGEFQASRFHLYLSEPGPAGSVYTQLATFDFRNA